MSPVTATAIIRWRRDRGETPGPRFPYVGVLATIRGDRGPTVATRLRLRHAALVRRGTIPVSRATGLSLLVLGVPTILTRGVPKLWPHRRLVGRRPAVAHLRAFLPATAGLVV